MPHPQSNASGLSPSVGNVIEPLSDAHARDWGETRTEWPRRIDLVRSAV